MYLMSDLLTRKGSPIRTGYVAGFKKPVSCLSTDNISDKVSLCVSQQSYMTLPASSGLHLPQRKSPTLPSAPVWKPSAMIESEGLLPPGSQLAIGGAERGTLIGEVATAVLAMQRCSSERNTAWGYVLWSSESHAQRRGWRAHHPTTPPLPARAEKLQSASSGPPLQRCRVLMTTADPL